MNTGPVHRNPEAVAPNDSYIEDSEPEREELRRKLKVEALERKRRQEEPFVISPNTSPQLCQTSRARPCTSEKPVELSDSIVCSESEKTNHRFREKVPSGSDADNMHEIIELSDQATQSASSTKHVNAQGVPTDIEIPVSQNFSAQDPYSNGTPAQAFENEPDDSEDDSEDVFRAKLGHFAYETASKSGRLIPVSHATSTNTDSGSNVSTKSKRTGATKTRLVVNIPDSDLSALLKCVSCDISWTTRKSVAQKVKHIQACYKKKGLTEETLNYLILQELDRTRRTMEEEKTKAASLADVPRTYLEGIVDEAGPKKKGKATCCSSVLLKVPQVVRAPEQTQTFGPSRLGAVVHLHSPADGESRRSIQSVELCAIGSASSDEGPVGTQAYAPSKIAARRHVGTESFTSQHGKSSNALSGDVSTISILSPSSSSSAHSYFPITAGSSSREPSLPHPSMSSSGPLDHRHSTPSTRSPVGSQSPPWLRGFSERVEGLQQHVYHVDFDDDPFRWANNAYIHFDPEAERMQFPSKRTSSTVKQTGISDAEEDMPLALSLLHTRHSQEERRKSSTIPEIAVQNKSRSKKGTKTKKRLGNEKSDGQTMDDVTFQSKLNSLVLEDEGLYLRILRYEPVSLETFMQLATSLAWEISQNTLKHKVKSFLDKKV
ncbi:hypothetical protein EW146_g5092 [Bondarzewia mesenterica]|uniref:Structure-specific endonuclease subunit SLX4 n=1 Tax=Bondarzewia mesenterica TaxID=1095465 RepID=A0A4S4LSI0_9AGAM|nr:hypothetical protein EW146_g5092 [Bondarzewia mesenterica]